MSASPVSIAMLLKYRFSIESAQAPYWLLNMLDKVTIQGLVVGWRRLEIGAIIIQVDDGWGSISCVIKGSLVAPKVSIGDCVRISGRPELFRRETQIVCQMVELLDDPIEDLAWGVELEEFWRALANRKRGKCFDLFYHFIQLRSKLQMLITFSAWALLNLRLFVLVFVMCMLIVIPDHLVPISPLIRYL